MKKANIFEDINRNPNLGNSVNSFLEIPNPFNPYDVESGRLFYHENVIEQIKNQFKHKSPFVIQGVTGSGKTSTLKKIIDDRTILGEKYFPIYLNSRDIKTNDFGAFLLFIYNTLKKILLKYNVQVDKPNYSFRSTLSMNEMKIFFTKVEELVSEESIIIIIFDDFEEFQQSINRELARDIFNFFEFAIHVRKKYRLILAGKGQIKDLAQLQGVELLLENAFQIDLGMFLEKEKIEKLIINPVEGYVKYDPLAVKEIVKITGSNFYCQQLLCNYIINYLNEQEKNVCTKEDVLIASERTINDRREDFNYFWENEPYESQLVYSALADENITKRIGRYYFIQEDPILDTIFDDDSLGSILQELHKDGYLNKIRGRRFDTYPFKIPLQGKWFQEKHPFLRTVTDNWDKIVDQISFSALYQIIKILPKKLIPLEKDIIETTIHLSQIWSDLEKSVKSDKIDRTRIEILVENLCDILGFRIKDKPEDRKTFFIINMNNLNLEGLQDVLFFVPSRNEISDLDIQYYQDEILKQAKPANPSFILCSSKSDKIQELAQKQFLGIVLITENDLKNLSLSSRPLQEFKQKVILKQIKPSIITTYKTAGPVTITFYGRSDEIGKIVRSQDKNFSIVGARKIGKTSLLYRIKEYLPSNTEAIYIDLESPKFQNYTSFLSILADEMSYLSKWFIDLKEDLSNMRTVIRKICQQTTKTPIFILDEIDELLKFDRTHEYKLIKTFRALFHERHCHIFLSGFEELFHEMRNMNSPLYNFCQMIHLDKLKEKDALELITSPMENIGIRYNDPSDREIILEKTSSHPNLIQFVCKLLIETIENKKEELKRRTIYRTDITDVVESFDYEDYIINDFYSFFSEEVDSIQKLIILLLVNNYATLSTITTRDISNLLKSHGIKISTEKLSKQLDDLRLRYILIGRKEGKYRFALPIFQEFLKKRNNIDDHIEEVLADAKKSI